MTLQSEDLEGGSIIYPCWRVSLTIESTSRHTSIIMLINKLKIK